MIIYVVWCHKKAHEEMKKQESSNQVCVFLGLPKINKDGTNALIIGEHPGKQNSHSVDNFSVV